MNDWSRLTKLAQPGVETTTSDQLLVVGGDTEVSAVIDYVTEWFGEDDGRSQLRLIIDGTDHGALARDDAFALALPADRGVWGTGDYGTLPGPTVQWQVITFHCTEPGCAVRAQALMYDPDDLPRCSVHDIPMTLDA